MARFLSELLRDVLLAKARVLILGGWEQPVAWRFVRYAHRHAHLSIPDDVYATISSGDYAKHRAWLYGM